MVSRTAPHGQPDPFATIDRPASPRPILRTRLFARLDGARATARGAWIEGPTGSGKTALASGWIEARRLRGTWVRIEDCACDPASVLQRLGAVGADRASPAPVVPSLAPADALDVARYARALTIRAFRRLGSGSVIVFDGWHAMPDHALAKPMAQGVVDGIPEGGVVLFLARRGQGDVPARLPVIGPHELRFDAREGESLARACGFTGGGLAGAWIAATGGWAAGMALFARARRFGVTIDPPGPHADPEALFRHCARELLGRLPEATRRVLACLARLPAFTPAMAAAACGTPGLEAVVEGIAREELFTEGGDRDDAAAGMRFAPVFRAFLIAGPDGPAPADRLSVAGLLEAAGWIDAAMTAALRSADWPAAARMAATHAPRRIAEGRTDLVAGWLRALPDEALHDAPWLSHWLARAMAPREPDGALAVLERAHARFVALADGHGALASALAALDLLTTRIVDPARLALWRTRFDAERANAAARLAPPDEARLIAGGLALLRAAPDHAVLEDWSARALACLDHAPDRDTRWRLAEFAARCFLQRGMTDRLDAALVRWRHAIGEDDLAPGRAALATVRAEQAWRAADLAAAADAVADGLAFVEHTGMRRDATGLRAIGALGWLVAGNAAQAADLAGDPSACAGCPPEEAALLAVAHIGTDLVEGRIATARAAAMAMDADRATPAAVLGSLARAQVHLAEGALEAAARVLERALVHAMQCHLPHLEFALRIQLSHVALAVGDRKALLRRLDEALAIGAAHGCMVAHPGWSPGAMTRLLGEALGMGVAPEYTRRLIAAHALRPVHPADERWPWPLRVRLLGNFELLLDGEAVHYGRKTPKRALELLKLVAVHGPAPIGVDAVVARLWPESSRESARRSFDVTVHRLRTLLGRASMVQVEGGRVGLDPRSCWVDCWHIDAPAAPGSANEVQATHLIALYRGRLLPEDETHAWLVPVRDRLHAAFVHQVVALGEALDAAGSQSHVESLYRHAIAVDPACEPVHVRMLAAYLRAGRRAEAVAQYLRLCQLLARVYGTQPSAAIETLMRPWL